MADDITLTVRVRDMTHGEFSRLDRQLDRMRRDLRGVGGQAQNTGMHSQRLGRDIDDLGRKFQRMQQTGRLSRRELTGLRHDLDAMSRSAVNAARSGEITHDRFRSLDSTIRSLRSDFDRLGAGLDDTSRRLRRTRTDGDGFVNTVRRAGNSVNNLGNKGSMVGKVFGNMRAKLIGTAVVLVASLLPTIGALAPMLAGVAAIVGVAALAFSGLSKPTKQLGKDEKDFLKGLKPLKKEFEQLQKTARKALLPELTKSFKDVGKAVSSMNPVIKIAGKSLGELVGKVAKGVASKDFMGPFLQNVKMGTRWVDQFAGSFGRFLKAFFEFGTKSQPALNAWQDLLGGFLDRGLPGMFTSMQSGIKGSSDYLLGLSSLINDGLLPGLGKLIGKFMQAFGPTIGKLLRGAGQFFNELAGDVGDVFVALSPVAKILGNVLGGLMDISRISFGALFDTLKELGGALLKTFTEVFGGDTSGMTSGLESISTWVQNNEGAIRSAFTRIGASFIEMVRAISVAAPEILNAFSIVTKGLLDFVGTQLTALDKLVGWIPGIGDKVSSAKKGFDKFSAGVKGGLDSAVQASKDFRDKLGPNLDRAQLSLKFDTAKRNLNDIKTALNDPTLTKKRKAELYVEKRKAQEALRDTARDLARFDKKQATAKLKADNKSFFTKFMQAQAAKLHDKMAKIRAQDQASGKISWIQRLLNNLNGTIAKTYVVTSYQQIRNKGYSGNSATGGHATGGWISGPGSGTSDSIPAMLSNGEFVVNARAARRNQGLLEVINNDGEPARFARGGHVSSSRARAAARAKAAAKVERDARSQMSGQFGVSFFGKIAGYQHTPFEVNAGKPQSLGDLVSSLNGLRGQIKAAFHGKQEGGLLHRLTSAGKALIKYEKKLGDVNKKLDAAKTKLDDLKQAAASLKDSVTSGVMSATDVTRVASGDNNVTMTDVMATMRESLDKSTAFADSLKRLQSRGVSKDIINQIAQAGISGGGLETAGALLGASDSEISSINDMQKQINANAKSAGKTAADAMYGAGIKAAEGLVKGLTKKQKDIENAMMRIAKSMEKAIKHALGIKSPSRVMMRIGHHTAEGFALGVAKNRKVPHAWESMLNVPSAGARAGVPSGGGGQYVFPIYVGGKFFDEVILDTNRRVVRTRGGDVQKVFGRN